MMKFAILSLALFGCAMAQSYNLLTIKACHDLKMASKNQFHQCMQGCAASCTATSNSVNGQGQGRFGQNGGGRQDRPGKECKMACVTEANNGVEPTKPERPQLCREARQCVQGCKTQFPKEAPSQECFSEMCKCMQAKSTSGVCALPANKAQLDCNGTPPPRPQRGQGRGQGGFQNGQQNGQNNGF